MPDLKNLLAKTHQKNEIYWLKFRIVDLTKDMEYERPCELMKSLLEKESPQFPLVKLAEIRYDLLCFDQGHDQVSQGTNQVSNQVSNQASDQGSGHEVIKKLDLSAMESRIFKNLLLQWNLKKSLLERNEELRILTSLDIVKEEKNRITKKKTYLKLEQDVLKLGHEGIKNAFYSQLKKEFPQYLNPSSENLLEIAQDHFRDRDFEKTKNLTNLIVNSKKQKLDTIQKAFKLKFRLAKTTQDKKLQESVISKWGKWLEQTRKKKKISNSLMDIWYSDFIVLKARWYWNENQTEKAIKIFLNNLNKISESQRKEEIFYTLGRIFEEKKDYSKSHSYYEKSLNVSSYNTSIFEKNLWSLSWIEYKNSDFKNSAAHLEFLISKNGDNSESKYLYWLSKNYNQLNDSKKCQEYTQRLRDTEPLSFYTLLTYRDKNEKIPLIPITENRQRMDSLREELSKNLSSQNIQEILWLISLKQNEELKQWSEYLTEKNKSHFLTSLILFAKAEMHSQLITAGNQLSADQKKDLAINHPELLFPKPYFNLVSYYSQNRIAPLNFIYSIMRQESAFDPFARSSVDAMGLLQLLPSLGRKLAQEEKIPFHDEFDLFKEEVNLNLGIKELSQLLKKFDARFIPAIASYNASSQAYARWIKSRYRKDPVEFIEEIPYEETRTYVKLILRNMIFYDRLYFKNQPFLFPEELLKL